MPIGGGISKVFVSASRELEPVTRTQLASLRGRVRDWEGWGPIDPLNGAAKRDLIYVLFNLFSIPDG